MTAGSLAVNPSQTIGAQISVVFASESTRVRQTSKTSKILLTLIALIGLSLPLAMGTSSPAKANFDDGWKKGRETGFPVPRFVSLKAHKARLRVGPGMDYAARWLYVTPGVPLEITEEYGHWRRVRDQDGTTGWMYASMLSGNRTAVVGPWLKKSLALHSDPSRGSSVSALLQARVALDIRHCDGRWCEARVRKGGMSGYVDQQSLWGVYPDETIK